MPTVEVTLGPTTREFKQKLAKAITEVMVGVWKEASRMDVTGGVVVIFRDVELDSYYVGSKPLGEVISQYPKVD